MDDHVFSFVFHFAETMCSPQAKRERVSQKEPVQGGTAKPSMEPRFQKEAYSNGIGKSPPSENGKMLQPVPTGSSPLPANGKMLQPVTTVSSPLSANGKMLQPVTKVTSGDNDLSLKVGLPIEK